MPVKAPATCRLFTYTRILDRRSRLIVNSGWTCVRDGHRRAVTQP
jgi:hypothetical protein